MPPITLTLAAVTATALSFVLPPAAAATPPGPLASEPAAMRIIDLGVSGTSVRPTLISDRGVVVGILYTSDSPGSRVFRWENGRSIELPGLGGESSLPAAVNARGQIVGSSNTPDGNDSAVLWQPDGTLVRLGPPGVTSYATGINRSGTVSGVSFTEDGMTRAVIWRDGAMIDLGDLGGAASLTVQGPATINDPGQVIGVAQNTAGQGVPVLWNEDGTAIELPTPPGVPENAAANVSAINNKGQVLLYTSEAGPSLSYIWTRQGISEIGRPEWLATGALDLNNHGDAAGTAEVAPGVYHAFKSTLRGGSTDLGTLGGWYSRANALNDRGQAVGESAIGPEDYHAVMWQRGVATDLGTLPGGRSSQALDINNQGEIAGVSIDADGTQHAVMWTVRCSSRT